MQLPKFNKKRLLAGSLLGLALSSTLLSTVYAQNINRLPMTVAPARQELVIEPGTSESLVIKFANYSENPLAGSVRAVDFIVRDATGTPFFLEDETISSKFSAAAWVSLPFDRTSIPSGEIVQIPVTITAPVDAAAGGRYLAIYFEPTGTLPNFDGSVQQGASGIVPRIAGLIYVRVAGPISENAQVVTFETPSFIEYGPIDATVEILNLGNYHISPRPKLTLTNLLTNTVVDETLLDEQNIFPEVSRKFEGQVGKKWLIGRYRLDMIASYGESGQGLLASAFIWAFPWRVALLLLLTLIIIIMTITLIKKSLTKKQHVLEDKLSEELKEVEELKEKYKDNLSQVAEANVDATKSKK